MWTNSGNPLVFSLPRKPYNVYENRGWKKKILAHEGEGGKPTASAGS
jgi:hypothetical protein